MSSIDSAFPWNSDRTSCLNNCWAVSTKSLGLQKTYKGEDFLVGDDGGLLVQDGIKLPVQ
jgi:hypothetical protein